MFNFLDPISRLDRHRRQILERHEIPPQLEPLFKVPLPHPSDLLYDCPILSIDFETTGLEPAQDSILSMGSIEIIHGEIRFDTLSYTLINNASKVKAKSAVINQLTPEILSHGVSLKQAVNEMIVKMAGKAVLAHCHVIEQTFLLEALGLKHNYELPIIWLDTMNLERSLIHRANEVRPLQLNSIRAARHLPDYSAHNALSDSVAAAELFLVQVKEIFGAKPAKLGAVYKRCI